MYSWTHTLYLEILPCSPCSSHGHWFARELGMESRAPGGSTGRPAGRRNDSSHKAMGSVCTTGPQLADTSDMGKGGPFLGTSPRSPWGSSSIFVPVQSKKVWRLRWVWSHFYLLFLLFTCFFKHSHRCSKNTQTHIHTLSAPASCSFDHRERSFSCYPWLHVRSSATDTHFKEAQIASLLCHTHESESEHILYMHTHLSHVNDTKLTALSNMIKSEVHLLSKFPWNLKLLDLR